MLGAGRLLAAVPAEGGGRGAAAWAGDGAGAAGGAGGRAAAAGGGGGRHRVPLLPSLRRVSEGSGCVCGGRPSC